MGEENTKKKSRRETIQLVIFIIAAVVLAYGVNAGVGAYSDSETSLVVVETGSMQPTLVGIYVFDGESHETNWSPFTADELFIKKIPATDLEIGDIIVFEDPRGGEIPIVHRIVEKYVKDGMYYFRTSGDNPWTNTQVDWWEIPQDDVIGKVIARVPRIGYFHLAIQTSFGRLLLLVAIIGLIASMFLFPDTSEDNNPQETEKTSSVKHETSIKEKKKEIKTKDLFLAVLVLLIITIPVLVNALGVITKDNDAQILSANIRMNPATPQQPQLTMTISLWSGGYFWNVLDNATIHVQNSLSSFYQEDPEFVWMSPYRWSGTKFISADFYIDLNAPQGTPISITLTSYFHNGFGSQWSEEVTTTIAAP